MPSKLAILPDLGPQEDADKILFLAELETTRADRGLSSGISTLSLTQRTRTTRPSTDVAWLASVVWWTFLNCATFTYTWTAAEPEILNKGGRADTLYYT